MFEKYLKDAHEFRIMAADAKRKGSIEKAKRCWRSAVFVANSALEAYLNYVADSFEKSQKLPDHERAFLNDKALFFSSDKMEVARRTEYHKTEDKMKLLIRKFNADVDLKNSSWSKFCQFKQFRDSLIHPRLPEDEIQPETYEKKLKLGLQSIIELMNALNQAIFRKPLRKKLLDLSPE